MTVSDFGSLSRKEMEVVVKLELPECRGCQGSSGEAKGGTVKKVPDIPAWVRVSLLPALPPS